MKICPDCNNKLTSVDTRGLFAFENRSLRVSWFIGFTFVIIVFSALILVLLHEDFYSIAFLIYFPSAFMLLHRVYKGKLDTIIYECTNCKSRFKGQNLEKFRYGG